MINITEIVIVKNSFLVISLLYKETKKREGAEIYNIMSDSIPVFLSFLNFESKNPKDDIAIIGKKIFKSSLMLINIWLL